MNAIEFLRNYRNSLLHYENWAELVKPIDEFLDYCNCGVPDGYESSAVNLVFKKGIRDKALEEIGRAGIIVEHEGVDYRIAVSHGVDGPSRLVSQMIEEEK